MVDIIPSINYNSKDCMTYLNRDENVLISKLTDSPISNVSLGVRWDRSHNQFADLDLGCLMLGVDTSLLDYVSFFQKTSKDGSIKHGGDNSDAAGIVDKEYLFINLSIVPEEVHFIAFYLSSFTGKSLSDMESCDVNLFNSESGIPLALCDCQGIESSGKTAVLLCLLIRTKTGWYFHNASSYAEGLLLRDNLEHLQGYVISNSAILRAMTRHRRDSI